MTVVVTLCSADRSERVARQNLFLHAGTIPFRHGIITLGPQQFDVPQVESIAHFPQLPVHLSAARNAAGRWAIEQAQPGEAIIFSTQIVFLPPPYYPPMYRLASSFLEVFILVP